MTADGSLRGRAAARDGWRYRVLALPEMRVAQIEPCCTGLGLIDASSAGSWPRHRHDDHEFIVPLDAGYRCFLDGEEVDTPAGAVLLVEPGDWHEDLLHSGGRHLGIWYRLRLAGGLEPGAELPLLAPGLPARSRVLQIAGLDQLVGELLAAQASAAPAAAPLAQSLAAVLFWRVVDALDPQLLAPAFARHRGAAAEALRLREALERHLTDAAAVERAAARLGLSPRQLGRRCRELLGAAPADWLRRRRMELAWSLVQDSDLPLRLVAERLGYADAFALSKAFRRHHGQAPAAVRAQRRPV